MWLVVLAIEVARAKLREEKIMSLTQDALDRIKAEGTTLDSIKQLVVQFVGSGDLTPEVAAAFNAALDANQAKMTDIEAALQPAPPPPTP